jgi:hypothetical protein
MNGILSISIYFILFCYILFNVVKTFAQTRKMNHATLFIYIFVVSSLCIIVSEGVLVYDLISYQNALIACKVSLGLFALSSLSVIIINILSGITTRKLKTLWRLPIIGVLAAWYLKPMHVVWLFLGVEIFSLVLLYKFKRNYNYSYRQQFKSLFGLFLICFSSFSNLWLFNLGFLLFLIMKLQIINAVKLKIVVSEYKKLEELNV